MTRIHNKRIFTSNGPGELLRLDEYGNLPSGVATKSTSVFELLIPDHTFSKLDVIYHNGTTWAKAIANNINTVGTHVVVSAVPGRIVAASSGRIEILSHGLTVGEYYFTSENTLGGLQTEEPLISNPMVYVESADIIHVLHYRPTITTQGTAQGLTLEGDLYVTGRIHEGSVELGQAESLDVKILNTSFLMNQIFRGL